LYISHLPEVGEPAQRGTAPQYVFRYFNTHIPRASDFDSNGYFLGCLGGIEEIQHVLRICRIYVFWSDVGARHLVTLYFFIA
jgi:hypothetical protein